MLKKLLNYLFRDMDLIIDSINVDLWNKKKFKIHFWRRDSDSVNYQRGTISFSWDSSAGLWIGDDEYSKTWGVISPSDYNVTITYS